MYNSDIKTKFLDCAYEAKNRRKYRAFFDTVEEFEESKEKDVALFTKEELIDYFEQIEIFNISTIKTNLSFFRTYRIWYNDNVERCEISWMRPDLVNEIRIEYSIKNSVYFSIEELLEDIDDDSHLQGVYYNVLYILGWYGVNFTEAAQIKKKDMTLSLDGTSLNIKNKIIDISITNKRCIQIIREFANLDSYEKEFSRNRVRRYEKNNVYLLRRFSKHDEYEEPAALTNSSFNPQTHPRFGKGKKRFNLATILLSGELCRLREAALNGKDLLEEIKKENPKANLTKQKARLETYEFYVKALYID